METFCEKKIREKLTGEKLQGAGVATTPLPLGCIRVNIVSNISFQAQGMYDKLHEMRMSGLDSKTIGQVLPK